MKSFPLAIVALLVSSAVLAQDHRPGAQAPSDFAAAGQRIAGDAESAASRRRAAAVLAPGADVAVPREDVLAPQESMAVDRPVAVLPQVPLPSSAAPPSECNAVRRGFDENGNPYVEETLSDGSVRREQERGITVTRPDGTSQFYRKDYALINAPVASQPQLPSDPDLGLRWMQWLNDELLGMITQLVNGDAAEIQKFSAAERQRAGDDVIQQIEFRTIVLAELSKR